MPRKPRIWYSGATYHIMCRGNHRQDIFRDDEDRNVYLTILKEVIQEDPKPGRTRNHVSSYRLTPKHRPDRRRFLRKQDRFFRGALHFRIRHP